MFALPIAQGQPRWEWSADQRKCSTKQLGAIATATGFWYHLKIIVTPTFYFLIFQPIDPVFSLATTYCLDVRSNTGRVTRTGTTPQHAQASGERLVRGYAKFYHNADEGRNGSHADGR